MKNLLAKIFNIKIAGETSNIILPDASGLETGIEYKSGINSNIPNGFFNHISEAIQYLQFTVGLFSDTAQYNEGNTCKMIVKMVNSQVSKYQVKMFRRNGLNPELVIGNCPLNCRFENTNGVDVYLIEDPNAEGLYNTHWDEIKFGDLKFHFTIGKDFASFGGGVNTNSKYVTYERFPLSTRDALIEAWDNHIPCYFFDYLINGLIHQGKMLAFSINSVTSITSILIQEGNSESQTWYSAYIYNCILPLNNIQIVEISKVKTISIPITKEEAMEVQNTEEEFLRDDGTLIYKGIKRINFPFTKWARNYIGSDVKIITAKLGGAFKRVENTSGYSIIDNIQGYQLQYIPIVTLKEKSFGGSYSIEGSSSEFICLVSTSSVNAGLIFCEGVGDVDSQQVGCATFGFKANASGRAWAIGVDTLIKEGSTTTWYRGKSMVYTNDMYIELISPTDSVFRQFDLSFNDFYIHITYQEVL